MWQNWINLTLGVWLIIAAFVPGITASQGASLWNDLVVGIVVLLVAIWAALQNRQSLCWLNALAGGWLLISAFIPGITAVQSGNLWNDLIIGIVITTVGVWAILHSGSTKTVATQ